MKSIPILIISIFVALLAKTEPVNSNFAVEAYESNSIDFINHGDKVMLYATDTMHIKNNSGDRIIAVKYSNGKTSILDTLYEEGGSAYIIDIALKNIDKNNNSELIILCAWRQQHRGLNINGIYYEPRIYSVTTSGFFIRKDLMKKIGNGFDGIQEGVKSIYEYKTAQSIIDLLNQNTKNDASDDSNSNICYKKKTTQETIDCLTEATQKWDTKLNAIYIKFKNLLPENEQKDLLNSQRKWIEFKENEIAFINNAFAWNPKAKETIVKIYRVEYILEITKQRTRMLQDYLEAYENSLK